MFDFSGVASNKKSLRDEVLINSVEWCRQVKITCLNWSDKAANKTIERVQLFCEGKIIGKVSINRKLKLSSYSEDNQTIFPG